ncbi:MAG TPA: tetratricopeptide repeat protein [Puia sp.]|nr:tetratricopeptide repeat protein [Puia sp.]
MKNKMRIGLLLVASVAGLCNIAFAQTVDQGKKFLYYQRYKSANDVFDKILAGNPNNIDAVYWKGQTLLAQHDSVAAGELYSKALQTNGNAPMLLAGMGGVELRMGKNQDARQRFETAISLTKGKDINVLNAVADNNIDARTGDAQYAIEKLVQATQIKNFNNADTYVLLGDAYRKQIDGGNAVQSYQKALALDPKLAEAKFKIGKIYETQKNVEFYMPAYQDAVQMDPNYAPAYYAMFTHYFYHGDVDKATENLTKYKNASDPSAETDYDITSLLFAAKKYDEAIAASKSQIQTLGDKVYPKYYLLMAYSYDAKGDSLSAKDNLNLYFTKQKADAITARDYSFQGKVLTRFHTDSVAAIAAYMKAIAMDTLLQNKLDIIKEAQDAARAMGAKGAYAYWLGVGYPYLKNPNQNDLYNWGFSNYSAGNYAAADTIFCGLYESKYPDQIFGYLWCKNSAIALDDSLWTRGLPIEAYQKLAAIARNLDSTAKAANSTDSIKYKRYVVEAYSQLAGYYNNVKKDKETAIFYLDQWIAVDPADPNPQKFKGILSRKPAPAARPAAGTKKAAAK